MHRNFLRTVAAAAVACMSSLAMAQSPVGNPGFEGALVYDVPTPPIGNWTGFFGGPPASMLDATASTVAPRNGTFALHLSVSGDGNAYCGMQQPITGIQAGESYTFSIWARRAGNVNNGVEYRIEWKDANNAFIGNQFALTTRIDSELTDTYQQFSLAAVAPPGAANCNLVVAVQSFVFNPLTPVFDTAVFIDDATFVAENPAPSTGACCNPSTGECVVTLESTCTTLGGSFLGANSACEPTACNGVQECRADFDLSGTVAVPDIFAFLSAWFAGCP